MSFHKIILMLFSVSLLTFSCSDNNNIIPIIPDIPSVPPTPDETTPKFSFTASKGSVNLFEGSNLFLTSKNNGGNDYGGSFLLSFYYDSVQWLIPGIEKYTATASRFRISTEQVFALPGEYKVTVIGFKDGKAVEKDSVRIHVAEPRDFLGISWKTIVDTAYITFENTLDNYILNLSCSSKNYPHALLKYRGVKITTDEEREKSRKTSRPFFYNYITTLYGESKFRFEGDDISLSPLADTYHARFKTPLNEIYGEVPVAIWETQTSYIALIGKKDSLLEGDSYFYYWVIAEPK